MDSIKNNKFLVGMKSTLLALFLLFSMSLNAQDTLRVLFLGNSYTTSNNLPQLVANFAEANGEVLIYDSNTPGGETLLGHSTHATSLQKICEGHWNYVVLQDQSQVPTIDYLRYNWMYPATESLHEDISEKNLCAKTVMYMTWGRQYGGMQCTSNGVYCSVDFEDFSHMTDTLASAYSEIADIVGAQVSPVGKAWDHALEYSTTDPALVLHSGDASHPNYSGSYLAAAVFHGLFWGESPVWNSFTGNLNQSQSAYLQESALITLNEYNASNSAITNDCVLSVEGNTLVCSEASNYTFSWYNEANEIIEGASSNTYSPVESGLYTVEVSNEFGCSITCSKSIEIQSVSDLTNTWKWVINNTLTATKSDSYTLRIYSDLGTIIYQKEFSGNEIQIPELSHGLYMISIDTPGKNTMPFIEKIIR